MIFCFQNHSVNYLIIMTSYELIINNIDESWLPALKTAEFEKINERLKKEAKCLKSGFLIFPPQELVFNCFKFFPLDKTKVVLLGQDPYINVGEAMGLCFSVPNDCKMPPSLRNIYKEIESDLEIKMDFTKKDLTKWAAQGILLLNTALTVIQKNSNIHSKLWQNYTDNIISYISQNGPDGIVFVLWGRNAQSKKKFIDNTKHHIIEGVHPSPLSASRGFFGSKPFSKINELLGKDNEIDLQL